MTLNELRYAVAVARERHFGRAAEGCFVSQPTLSVAVRKLEDELGITLFERGPGEVTVTAVGQQVVEQAQRVLEEADAVRRIARHGKDPLVGVLRLGVIYTVGPYLLPYLIPFAREQAPYMPLVVEESYTAALAERLKRGELDLIVVSLPFEEPGILTRPLYDEDLVVLLPASHPLAARDRISVADLAGEEVLLLGPGHCFRDQVLRACPSCLEPGTAGRSMQRRVEGGSLETIRCMVASGVGITVLPCTAVRGDAFSAHGLLCVRPFVDPPHRRVAFAWRRSFPRIEAVELIARAVRSAALPCVDYARETE